VRYTGRRGYCPLCDKAYLPPALERSRNQIYGRGLQAWAVYQRIALRLSYRLIAKAIQDFFHERIEPGVIEALVNQCSDRYARTEALLLRQLLQSPVVHVDETKMSILGVHQFVWVITDGSHVLFRLTETRETDFLRQLLAGFSGTLVSDFYCGYDSLPWRQQKCLVHLIRDLNDDLWKNPFDVEYEQFVSAVRDLLGPMLEDVQRFGLKAIHLRKHQKQVERFYKQRIGEVLAITNSPPNTRNDSSGTETRFSVSWTMMGFPGTTTPQSGRYVTWRYNAKFPAPFRNRGPAVTFACLPSRRRAGFRINRF
jgi:transposase-like protein